MNKPIKLTQEITNPNDLLNKFIIYKYKDDITILYFYKIDKTILFDFNGYYTSMTRYDRINFDIENSFKKFIGYEMYIM